MNAKHQFKYTYNEIGLEEFSPVEVTFEMPGDVTINQMLYNFESYLKACGFYFDGHLEIVEEEPVWPSDSIGWDNEPQGGCMADFDKECGCLGDSMSPKEYQDQRLKEWNKGLTKLEKDIQEERAIREKASLRADELKEMNEKWNKLNYDQKMKIYEESIKESEDKYPIEPLYKKVGTLNKS